jgi:hypothetical protein
VPHEREFQILLQSLTAREWRHVTECYTGLRTSFAGSCEDGSGPGGSVIGGSS